MTIDLRYIEDNDILCPMKALNKISLLIMVMAGLLTVWCTAFLSEEDYPALPDNYAYTVRLKCFCYLVAPFIISYDLSWIDICIHIHGIQRRESLHYVSLCHKVLRDSRSI